jgi:hypothetical protein
MIKSAIRGLGTVLNVAGDTVKKIVFALVALLLGVMVIVTGFTVIVIEVIQ